MAEDDTAAAAEKYAAWITPREALQALEHLETRTAILTIFDRLKYGLVKAIAGTQIFRNARNQCVPIDNSTWAHAELGIAVSSFWTTGDITIQLQVRSAPYGYQEFPFALFGVRFDPAGIRELQPNNPSLSPTTPTIAVESIIPPSKGGRPPKGWWDDLWVEMARQLYSGDLQPKNQAQIEKAMADWVFAAFSEEASERTFRNAAQKLWRMWQKEEGKN